MPASEPTPKAQFAEFLSRFPAEIIALVKRCFPKLRRALPGTYEMVYDYSHSVVVSFTMTGHGSDGIVAMAVLPGGVTLYFDKSLPDPKGLLEGTGGKVRSVTIKTASELDKGDIHDLLKAAIKRSGVKFPKTGSTRMIIKSEAKKKPRKKR